jgi:biotin carboxyl carrier protein
MQYEIEVGGRIRHVSVAREGATFAITVDGRTRRVDVARIDAHTLSLILDNVWPADAVVFSSPANGHLTVDVNGASVPVVLNGRLRSADAAETKGPKGSDRLVAPMPGKVVRVLVKAGDVVSARQPLVVVEAMKMENELRAGRDGTVAEVRAREGQSVDAGALLIVIQ